MGFTAVQPAGRVQGAILRGRASPGKAVANSVPRVANSVLPIANSLLLLLPQTGKTARSARGHHSPLHRHAFPTAPKTRHPAPTRPRLVFTQRTPRPPRSSSLGQEFAPENPRFGRLFRNFAQYSRARGVGEVEDDADVREEGLDPGDDPEFRSPKLVAPDSCSSPVARDEN